MGNAARKPPNDLKFLRQPNLFLKLDFIGYILSDANICWFFRKLVAA
jgi:hypothetical protein